MKAKLLAIAIRRNRRIELMQKVARTNADAT